MNMTKEITFSEAIKIYKFQLLLVFLLLTGIYYSIYPLMVSEWYDDPNYSHGFIIPLLSGLVFYKEYSELKKIKVAPDYSGLLMVFGGVVLLIIAYVGTEYFTMRASSIVILSGIILYLFGKEIFRKLRFPLGYLLFMIPLPYIVYDAIAFPLKLMVAKYSVLFLQTIGIIVRREGNMILFPNIELEVVDACSGIRSLMSLLALSVGFAYFTGLTSWKKFILIFSAVPIAIFVNGLRVIITGILTQYWGMAAAEGFFHEFTGLVVFGLALVFIILVWKILAGKEKNKE